MGLNRMMMKSNEILKDIEANMVVGYSALWLGFLDLDSVGQLSPNPLPNGVRVSSVAFSASDGTIQLRPASIKSCTLNDIDITVTHGEAAPDIVVNYLGSHVRFAIPITLHF